MSIKCHSHNHRRNATKKSSLQSKTVVQPRAKNRDIYRFLRWGKRNKPSFSKGEERWIKKLNPFLDVVSNYVEYARTDIYRGGKWKRHWYFLKHIGRIIDSVRDNGSQPIPIPEFLNPIPGKKLGRLDDKFELMKIHILTRGRYDILRFAEDYKLDQRPGYNRRRIQRSLRFEVRF